MRTSRLINYLCYPERYLAFHRGESLALKQPEPPATASDRLPARLTGSWVRDKNYFVERYLTIFSRGVGRKWEGKLSYVDLFSGPGKSIIRDTGQEVDGSPLLALKCDFARYVFVDVPDVLSTLARRLDGHPKSPQISFIEGDCNLVVGDVLRKMPADHLTLAFIDPTGLQIRFNTIKRLVRGHKIDLLMTVQLGMGIRMNLPLYAQPGGGAALTAFMGNSLWRTDLTAGGSASQISRRILKRYLQQLRRLGYGTVQDRDIDVRSDQSNLLLYFIILASRHRLGESFWRKATQILPSGQRFLDLRNEE